MGGNELRKAPDRFAPLSMALFDDDVNLSRINTKPIGLFLFHNSTRDTTTTPGMPRNSITMLDDCP